MVIIHDVYLYQKAGNDTKAVNSLTGEVRVDKAAIRPVHVQAGNIVKTQ